MKVEDKGPDRERKKVRLERNKNIQRITHTTKSEDHICVSFILCHRRHIKRFTANGVAVPFVICLYFTKIIFSFRLEIHQIAMCSTESHNFTCSFHHHHSLSFSSHLFKYIFMNQRVCVCVYFSILEYVFICSVD